jgi:hypothetical protein
MVPQFDWISAASDKGHAVIARSHLHAPLFLPPKIVGSCVLFGCTVGPISQLYSFFCALKIKKMAKHRTAPAPSRPPRTRISTVAELSEQGDQKLKQAPRRAGIKGVDISPDERVSLHAASHLLLSALKEKLGCRFRSPPISRIHLWPNVTRRRVWTIESRSIGNPT